MNENVVINAETREKLSKGANRSYRKAGLIPAVLYSKTGNTNLLVSTKVLPKVHSKSAPVNLVVNGTTKLVLMREVQVNPLSREPIHMDFQEVSLDDKVNAYLPINFVGFSREQEKEGMFRILSRSALVKGKISDFPSLVEIDVSKLKLGDSVHVKDLDIPATLSVKESSSRVFAQFVAKGV